MREKTKLFTVNNYLQNLSNCSYFKKSETQKVAVDANMLPHCLVVGSTVTALCATEMMKNCMINTNMRIAAIPTNHTSIAETITTTNIIMANWSRGMWQSVLNRAIRMLATGHTSGNRSFGSHFFSAVVTVS
ncbi:hypothetical protein KIN20_003245 [Parelaphostrongylus tenuis]|uniref:Uncharacterized protein n=1 Tax=Parelaphostrongylus tenuis TaxID=148309 RepID=A0AAD5M119_PARTN|nr:hypothetical protein KIN20_003245 [Parelaphostrongylus tenuis]